MPTPVQDNETDIYKTFLVGLDLKGNKIINAGGDTYDILPATGSTGQIVFHEGTSLLNYYKGTEVTATPLQDKIDVSAVSSDLSVSLTEGSLEITLPRASSGQGGTISPADFGTISDATPDDHLETLVKRSGTGGFSADHVYITGDPTHANMAVPKSFMETSVAERMLSVVSDSSMTGTGVDGDMLGTNRALIGLSMVDDTSDMEKPVSIPTLEALEAKSDKYSKVRYIKNEISGSSTNSSNLWVAVHCFGKDEERILLASASVDSGATDVTSIINQDGDMTDYAVGPLGSSRALVCDLGSIMEISSIRIWHYYLDGRRFYGNKTKISEDGSNWTTIEEGDVFGIYDETKEGHLAMSHNTSYVNSAGRRAALHIERQEIHVDAVAVAKLEAATAVGPFIGSLLEVNWNPVTIGSPIEEYPYGWAHGESSYMNGSTEQNSIAYDSGANTPHGYPGNIWVCTPEEGSLSTSGGYNTKYVEVDETKRHRICTWARRPSLGAPITNGTIYAGLRMKSSEGLGMQISGNQDSPSGNFYSWLGDLPAHDVWYLIVQYIEPAGSPGYSNSEIKGGIYEHGSSDRLTASVQDAIFPSGAKFMAIRAYNHYTSDLNSSLWFYHPRIDVADGTEVPLETLLQAPSLMVSVETSVEKKEGDIYYHEGTKTVRMYDGTDHWTLDKTIVA